jgi:hypothetical protein
LKPGKEGNMNMEYVDNLIDLWEEIPESVREAGREWYPKAHELAREIGNGDVIIGAGILAALSPQKAWDINIRLAYRIASGDFSGHVTDALDKCRAIMAGCNPSEVLPVGKKTWHFFHNIAFPIAECWVTIDRHAYRAATYDWGNGSPVLNKTTYREIGTAYIVGAREVGEIPCDWQAGIWEWVRMQAA